MQKEGKKLEVPTYNGPLLYEAVAKREPRLLTATQQALALVRETGLPILKSKDNIYLEDRVAEQIKSRLACLQVWQTNDGKPTEEMLALNDWQKECNLLLMRDYKRLLPQEKFVPGGELPLNTKIRMNIDHMINMAVSLGRCSLYPDFSMENQGIILKDFLAELTNGTARYSPNHKKIWAFLRSKREDDDRISQNQRALYSFDMR